MARINGGIIGPDNIPSGPLGSASGVWKLSDAFNYQKEGLWPVVTGITYPVANSLRFNSGSSDNLSRNTSGTGTSNQKFTMSLWVKKSSTDSAVRRLIELYNASTHYVSFRFRDDSSSRLDFYSESNGASVNLRTNRSFRDLSAWYHLVLSVDTTLATADDRMKMYVNGVQETSFALRTNPSLNENLNFNNSGNGQYIARAVGTETDRMFDGYMSDVNFIDGQQLAATDFGETDSVSGNWKAKAYSGSYGTNGFFLEFKDSSALGDDTSGNTNDFTVNNLTSVDQSTDTPTNNFATWNPLWFTGTTVPNTSFTDGNLTVQTATTGSAEIQGTLGINSGKWYYEFKMTSTGTGSGLAVGFANNNYTDSLTYYSDNGYKYTESGSSAYGATWTTDDIIGVAFDADNNTMTFYKNGTSQGVITSAFSNLSTDFYLPLMWDGSGSLYANGSVNFGSPPYAANGYADGNGFGDFSYAVPTGYYALNTQNLNVQG